MTLKLQRILWLWAAVLVLALLLIIPLAIWVRLVLGLITLCGVALAWTLGNRRIAHQRKSVILDDNRQLPSASFRHPVVLTCGDGLEGLFGTTPLERLALRITGQGCYVRVPSLEQLPSVAESILALRPGWGGQLCVTLIVNPGAHSDGAVLAGQMRSFSHQLALARKRGIALPLLLVSYLQTLQGQSAWFSWDNGQAEARVRDAGACINVTDWQQQAADSSTHAARLHACVQLGSAASWLHEAIMPHLHARDARGPLAMSCAIKLVSALPQAVPGNLWQQWLHRKLALVDSRPMVAGAVLPFPDPMLSLLPLGPLRSPGRQASIVGLWLFAAAAVVAFANSAWQNTLLVRQISDDLRRYTAAPLPVHRDQRDFLLREDAVTVLRQDARRLDTYYRHGEPLALGLGLYRGERLRAQLLAVLAAHVEPAAPALPVQMPRAVRLDSLSLFGAGSAALKPGSTKVLINALVGIKAQPGWLIMIAGHTDATGPDQQNLALSHARASAVRDWMQRMGDIADSCFAVQGLAAKQPIASNHTEAGRRANRRVDIHLIPQVGACEPIILGTGNDTSS